MQQQRLMVRNEVVRAGTYVLVTTLWHHVRHERWPSSIEISRAASWRTPHRAEAVEWLYEMRFLIRERNVDNRIHYRVTEEGRQFVTIPPTVPVSGLSLEDMALPDDDDEFALVNWMRNFYNRTGQWPTPWNYASCGLYQRDRVVFREALERLAMRKRIARVQIRRGPRNVTRTIDAAMCPAFADKDGCIYFWSTVNGPFPEP